MAAHRDLGTTSAPTAATGFAPRLGSALNRALAATLACPACRAAACGPEGLCLGCANGLRASVAALPPPVGDVVWLGPHAGIWRRLVHALKYRHTRRLAGYLARLLHDRTQAWGWQPHLVTHLPTTALRRRQRSYDQAELLAAHLARCGRLPHLRVLRRHGNTTKLARLGRAARAASLAQAFTATPVVGRRILLVDDVLTTGASFGAARRALLAAGAAEVRAAVVARTAPRNLDSTVLAAALALLQPPPGSLMQTGRLEELIDSEGGY